MKQKLCSAPILAFPKFDSPHPFVLYTDASAVAVACMITQVQDGMERVLLYGSRKNNPAQQKYHSNRLELMSFVWSCESNKYLLFPRFFIWCSDNNSLRHIRTMFPPRGLIARWLNTLSNFNFEVRHKKGKQMTHVDFLSRSGASDDNLKKISVEETDE